MKYLKVREKGEKNSFEESSEKIENGIKKAIDGALDENTDEIEKMTGNSSDEPAPVHNDISKLKQTMTTVFGGFVLLMAVVGVLSTFFFFKGKINDIRNNSAEKAMFESYVFPLVVTDAPAFDNQHNLSSEIMLTAAAWDIILYPNDKYTEEFGYITVPAIDVEARAAKLFGTGLSFVHQTLGDIELSFPYDEATKTYKLPVSPHYLSYVPKVEEIDRVNELYTLKVGYYSPMSTWLPSREAKPDKYMFYTVLKRGDSYCITAIKQGEIVEAGM